MSATDTAEQLPDYADSLAALHRAFAREYRRTVRAVPLEPGSRVLDLPCGDGFFTAALARRLHPFGSVTAADISDAYLDCARRTIASRSRVAAVEFVKADAYRLPFDDESFDVVWCAQSLISLEQPVAALKEMRRVVRTGGTVAVLEEDEFHRVVVNWPSELELAVQQAVAEATLKKYGTRSHLSPARRMRQFFLDAGLKPGPKRTFAADRQAPFGPAVRDYLRHYFRDLREYIGGELPADQLAAFDRATDPAGEHSLFRREDAALTCLTTLFLAEK